MEKKVKATIVLITALIAATAFLMIPNAFAEVSDEAEMNSERNRWQPQTKLRLLIYVLRNSVPSQFQAEVVTLEGRILVASIDDELVNINMPRRWAVEGEVFSVQDLIDGDPLGPGDTITISALKLEMIKDTHSITSYFSYTLESEGITASAILPFNIEA